VASPLWREWLLSCGAEEVHVVEGLIDAMALAKATGAATVALGGTAGARRMAQVVHAAPPALRPRRVVVCMDEDEAGRRARDAICADLDALGVPHAALPPYPGGAKDADEWLVAGRGTEWEFVREGGLWKTRWL
jgi:DNA primase